MTPTQLRDCLEELRWSQRGLAQVLGCNDRIVRRWTAGDGEIPAAIAEWLYKLCAHFRQFPPPDPQLWRRRTL